MKAALITGASRGIGAAIAKAYAAAGYCVTINYNKSQSAAEEVAEDIRRAGGTAFLEQADVSDPAAARELVLGAARRFRGLDVLVNNAGIAESRLITQVTPEEYRRMVGVNLTGTFFACQAAAEIMTARMSGSIVNISSVWGVSGASCECLYSATKAAVIGLTRALSKELGPSNVRVNCVAPGVIQTDMNRSLSATDRAALADAAALGRLGTPEEVAQAAVFLGDSAGFITGQVITVDGGFL